MNSRHVIVLAVTLAIVGWPGETVTSAADEDIVDARLVDRYTSMLDNVRTQLTANLPQTDDDAGVGALLTDGALDAILVKGAVLRDGTPEGLAKFAQHSKEHERMIEQLLVDTELSRGSGGFPSLVGVTFDAAASAGTVLIVRW